jgi:Na+/proline symporter
LNLDTRLAQVLITYIQKRYTSFDPNKTEEFLSAEKSIKPGLIAVGIVSAWTWAATLLQSGFIIILVCVAVARNSGC